MIYVIRINFIRKIEILFTTHSICEYAKQFFFLSNACPLRVCRSEKRDGRNSSNTIEGMSHVVSAAIWLAADRAARDTFLSVPHISTIFVPLPPCLTLSGGRSLHQWIERRGRRAHPKRQAAAASSVKTERREAGARCGQSDSGRRPNRTCPSSGHQLTLGQRLNLQCNLNPVNQFEWRRNLKKIPAGKNLKNLFGCHDLRATQQSWNH